MTGFKKDCIFGPQENSNPIQLSLTNAMNIPDNLLYTKDHEWVQAEGEIAIIGITDYAQKELGDIVYIEVDTVGESLAKEETFGTIEAVKTVSDLFMPVAGEIIEMNETLESQPDLVNKDPYGQGWIIRIKISDASDLNDLLTSAQYREIIGV